MKIDLNNPGALTLESVSKLIGSVNDSTHTQLRVSDEGVAFMSNTDVGNQNTEGLAFRLETWCQGNDYVGQRASGDAEWVGRIYKVLKENWPEPSSTYFDVY
ncbi:hypothetical protein [Pseudomonas sp. PGPR40]|uniref:hypothetical protein n=1 Tax=Pseudomonas sp. PGPR40 TaxID=2913476 RepID=UPI001EDA8ED8|nr:hypothetical protein [Pseudomonas sp. PGPR40]